MKMPRKLPIIFSGVMVRALLAGRKTMTRRLALTPNDNPSTWQRIQAGDMLWARESFRIDQGVACYAADCADAIRALHVWAPSIHLPRFRSRLTLIVTAKRTERLQNITKADVLAEGISERNGTSLSDVFTGWHEPFAALWDSLHTDERCNWSANPEVVAISFSVQKRNIDVEPSR